MSNQQTERPTDEEILQFETSLRESQAAAQPLVGIDESLVDLKGEYERGNPIFCAKIDFLIGRNFDRFRRCRGDGNCFFRAYGFRLFEYYLDRPDILPVVSECYRTEHKSQLLMAGFEEFAFIDFYDEFFDLVDGLQDLSAYMEKHQLPVNSDQHKNLHSVFCNNIISNSVVVHLRFLTSAYLKNNAEMYAPFLDDGMTIDVFCAQFVEAMDREADQIHLIALSQVMHTGISVAYLDSDMSTSEATVHKFEVELSSELYPNFDDIHLLYRPGHYDILYRTNANQAISQ